MSYVKQNFKTGDVLTATQMNKIEAGIVANESAIAQKQDKGNYVTKTEADNAYASKENTYTKTEVDNKIANAGSGGSGVDLGEYLKKTEASQTYQDKLVSGSNIKTINGQSILGSGDIEITSGSNDATASFTDAECRQAFMSEMTAISKRLGAKSSTWIDPTGIKNKSTASDMCKILLHASGYEKLYDIWNTPSWDAKRIKADGSVVTSTITSSVVSNTSSPNLTDYYNVMGGKTGTLNSPATNNLGVIVQSAKNANTLYAVAVLKADTNNSGTGNRFVATKEVMDIVESDTQTDGDGASPVVPNSFLDTVAWENLTWRTIFVTNNYAPKLNSGSYASSKAATYTVANGTCTVRTDENNAENYVPPYYLDCSGTVSCQITSATKATMNNTYLLGCNVNVTSYSKGYCGVFIGAGATNCAVQRVTDGWESLTGRVKPTSSGANGIYIGSATSASLNGGVNNPVIVDSKIFTTVPSEAEWQQLYATYTQKLVEERNAVNEPEIDGGDNEESGEEVILPEPQASYICAMKVPRLPRAFQYLNIRPSYEKNADTEWYPASMSKILTGIVVLNYVSDLNEKVKVLQKDIDELNSYGSGWYASDILAGETITYLDLLYFMFLPSSNIATQIVCRAVGEKILKTRHL